MTFDAIHEAMHEAMDETETDAETDADPEAEPEAEPEATPATDPPSDAAAEAAWRDAEKASASYVKRAEKVLSGFDDALAACPLCLPNLRGYIDVRDMGKLPDETIEVVRTFLGDTLPADYKPSPTFHRCEACDGLGKVATGSRVPNRDTLLCPECEGGGFVPPAGKVPASPLITATPPVVGMVDQSPAVAEDVDAWGSPRLLANGLDNPNFGRMPQYRDPAYP